MKKYSILLLAILFISFNCIDPYRRSHLVDLDHFAGEWLFTNSIYDESEPFENLGFIHLFDDSTFYSTFSYFWDKNSFNNDSLNGKWYPYYTGTDRTNYYNELIFKVNGITKRWRVNGSVESGNLTWYSDRDGNDEEFYWAIND